MQLKSEDYKEICERYFEIQNKPKVVPRVIRRLTNLGYYVTLQRGTDLASLNIRSGSSAANTATLCPVIEAQELPRRGRGRPCKCASRGIVCKHQSRPTSSTKHDSIAEYLS
jgi:hypothetical protein